MLSKLRNDEAVRKNESRVTNEILLDIYGTEELP